MQLLVLGDHPGLRAALRAQFADHPQPVYFDCLPQPLLENDDCEQRLLIVDCRGENNTACEPPDQSIAKLVALAQAREWPWLLLSDCRVFADGKQRYRESDPPEPTSARAMQLLAREAFVAQHLSQHIVLRVGRLLAALGGNLLTDTLQQIRRGGVVYAAESPRFCPVAAGDIARVIAAIHDQLDCGATCWGVYHYQSSDITTGYEFAEVLLAAAAQYWDLDARPVELRTATGGVIDEIFPLLHCQRIRDTFGIQQLPWRKAIPGILKQIYTSATS